VNNITLTEETAHELTLLIKNNTIAWEEFIDFIKGRPFNIRREIANRLPQDGLCF